MSAHKLNDLKKSYGCFYVIVQIISVFVCEEIVVLITFDSPSVTFAILSIIIHELFESFLSFFLCGICFRIILQNLTVTNLVYFYNEHFHNLKFVGLKKKRSVIHTPFPIGLIT